MAMHRPFIARGMSRVDVVKLQSRQGWLQKNIVWSGDIIWRVIHFATLATSHVCREQTHSFFRYCEEDLLSNRLLSLKRQIAQVSDRVGAFCNLL